MKFADKLRLQAPQIQKIIKIGDPEFHILQENSSLVQSISPKMQVQIESLKMTAASYGLVSLNAKQIGLQQAFFVMRKIFTRNTWFNEQSVCDYNVFINPKVMGTSQLQQVEWDECPSFPYTMAKVKRPDTIQVQFRDEKFNLREFTLQDFYARVFMHECDHFKGILLEAEDSYLAESHRKQNDVGKINLDKMMQDQQGMDSFTHSLKGKSNKNV